MLKFVNIFQVGILDQNGKEISCDLNKKYKNTRFVIFLKVDEFSNIEILKRGYETSNQDFNS